LGTLEQSREHDPRPSALVGVLWSGEPQIRSCLRSLYKQGDIDLGYFVISHRSKQDAHNLLYSTFQRHGPAFDLLVKLDGDMVLDDPHLIERASAYLARHHHVDVLHIPVFDEFTQRDIVGMHVYRPSVRWTARSDNLFTDANDTPEDRQAVSKLGTDRAILHCPDPSDFQAFHYGVHRGVKLRAAISGGRRRYVRSHARQVRSVADLGAHAPQHRVLAAWGMGVGLRGEFVEEHVSYTRSELLTYFEREIEPLSPAEREHSAKRRLRRAVLAQPRLVAVLVLTAVRDRVRR
jgi:hypothetical protein